MRTTFGKLKAPAPAQRAPRKGVQPAVMAAAELPRRPDAGDAAAASGKGPATIAGLLIVLIGLIVLHAGMTLDLALERKGQLLLVAGSIVFGGGFWLAHTLGLVSRNRKHSSDGGADFGLFGSPGGDAGSGDGGGDGGGD